MSTLAGKHIVLGLSGGIAAFKSAELCRALVKAGVTVQVVMTEAAEHFMTAVTMQSRSGRPVYTSQWGAREANNCIVFTYPNPRDYGECRKPSYA